MGSEDEQQDLQCFHSGHRHQNRYHIHVQIVRRLGDVAWGRRKDYDSGFVLVVSRSPGELPWERREERTRTRLEEKQIAGTKRNEWMNDNKLVLRLGGMRTMQIEREITRALNSHAGLVTSVIGPWTMNYHVIIRSRDYRASHVVIVGCLVP
jgi:hypothetical protein